MVKAGKPVGGKAPTSKPASTGAQSGAAKAGAASAKPVAAPRAQGGPAKPAGRPGKK